MKSQLTQQARTSEKSATRRIAGAVALLLVSTFVLQACPPAEQATVDETPTSVTVVEADSVAPDVQFDPLGAEGELTIVPEELKDSLTISFTTSGGDSLSDGALSHQDLLGARVEKITDTAAYDTYRIQLYNSRVYTEAALERVVATEIFDYTVTLDYEVPYFKVRIGDFQSAKVAEEYLKEYVKPAGYPDSWVARVRVTPQKSAAAQAQLTAYFDSLRTAIMLEGLDIDALDSLGVLDSLLNEGALDSSAIDSLLPDSSVTEDGDE